MKKTLILTLILATALLTSCGTMMPWSKEAKLEKKELEKKQVDYDLTERSRVFTAAILDVASFDIDQAMINEIVPAPTVRLIQLLAQEDARIEGQPVERLDFMILLQDLEKARLVIGKFKDQNIAMLRSQKDLNLTISSLNAQILEEKSNWFGNMLGWITGFGIIGILVAIVLVVLFPTIGIPLISFIVGWVTSTFPKIIGLFGVVSKNIIDSVISGHEEVKKLVTKSDFFEKNLTHYPEDKVFTKAEVHTYLVKLKSDFAEAMSHKMQAAGDSSGKVNRVVSQRRADMKR